MKIRGTYFARTIRHYSRRRKPRRPTSCLFLRAHGSARRKRCLYNRRVTSVEGSPSLALPPSSLLPPGIFSPKPRAAPHPHFVYHFVYVTDSLEKRAKGKVSLCYRKKHFLLPNAQTREPYQQRKNARLKFSTRLEFINFSFSTS